MVRQSNINLKITDSQYGQTMCHSAAFNAEKSIEKCIRSIMKNWEWGRLFEYQVLATNDGPTDNTLNILRNLADEYPNLTVLT